MLNQTHLSKIQKEAIAELQLQVNACFEIVSYQLYGSIVRDQADAESDIDILILTKNPLSRRQRHRITDIIFEINLAYGTNISSLVLPIEAWQNGIYAVSPFKQAVMEESIAL